MARIKDSCLVGRLAGTTFFAKSSGLPEGRGSG